jgi:hypothetical protein
METKNLDAIDRVAEEASSPEINLTDKGKRPNQMFFLDNQFAGTQTTSNSINEKSACQYS